MPYPDGSTLNVDADIAVLKSKVEDLEENQAVLFERIRTNEKWIAGAGAVLTVAMAILGLVAAVDAETRIETIKTEYQGTKVFNQG
tara:strand:+ start:269 stop:526 length:258 start_codon:yes stop_codon:yes gene_type:complete